VETMTTPPSTDSTEWLHVNVESDQVDAFFASPKLAALKDEICDIGRRLWQRAYVDGNGGNISARVAANLVLCTPTQVSKGFMKPADLCLVDMEGNQKAGSKKRTSEVLMHLEIYKAQPAALACAHAHPPYATGFAVAGVTPPMSLLPEMELFCGAVPLAPYSTPGAPEIGRAVAALVGQHTTVLMGNHGAVSWGKSVEDAYFKMEIIEAYCRTALVARQVSSQPNVISTPQLRELFAIKQSLGMPDPREKLSDNDLDARAGWKATSPSDAQTEALVQRITEEVLRALRK
jgi:L-fuculose-phosphate aldolase